MHEQSWHGRPTGPWRDISQPITAESIAWDGLATPELTWDARIADGDAINAGRMRLSLHTGSHADAPKHVDARGKDIAGVDPGLYVGPAQLVHVPDVEVIDQHALRDAGLDHNAMPTRLLIATARPYDGRRFPSRVPHLDPPAARWLVGSGVHLVGIDQPSVDPLDSRELAAHHALLGGGAVILENLDLRDVPAGVYLLVAAPLMIVGGDAAPVRALLRPWRAERT